VQITITRPTHHGGRWRFAGECLECGRSEGEALIRSGVAEAGARAVTVGQADGPVRVVLDDRGDVRHLGETIRSVLQSEPRPDRLVMLDDSRDVQRREYLEEVAALHPGLVEIRRCEAHCGPAAALATLTRDLPPGAVVVELRCGDALERGALAEMLDALRTGGKSFVYGDFIVVDERGRAEMTFRCPPYVPWQFREIGPPLPVAGVRGYRKELLGGALGGDPGAAARDELPMRIERILSGRGIEAIGQVLSRVRLVPGLPGGPGGRAASRAAALEEVCP